MTDEVTNLPVLGLTMASVERSTSPLEGDVIVFTATDGRVFRMEHFQNCCENVEIGDIEGDLRDLVGEPITIAYESSRAPVDGEEGFGSESATWTFYRLATVKGHVVIRWLGTSNGYYSESVSLYEVTK